MDPRSQGPIKYGLSAHPSTLLSVLPSVSKFSWDWHISFFWNLAWCYGPIFSCVWQSWMFWKKSPSGKNDQKLSKMTQKHVFGLFKKINSFVWNLGKMKVLMVINTLQKLHTWEKFGSQFIAKNGSWPKRFQYSFSIL